MSMTPTRLPGTFLGRLCLELATYAGKVEVEAYRTESDWTMQTDEHWMNVVLVDRLSIPKVAIRVPLDWLMEPTEVIIQRLKDKWPDFFEAPMRDIEFNEEVLASG
jgi:hypothetical protein